jgi:hypothetical protein
MNAATLMGRRDHDTTLRTVSGPTVAPLDESVLRVADIVQCGLVVVTRCDEVVYTTTWKFEL